MIPGAGDTIPADADLIFDIEVVDIDREYHEDILVDKECTKKQQSRDQDQVFFNYIGRLSNGEPSHPEIMSFRERGHPFRTYASRGVGGGLAL